MNSLALSGAFWQKTLCSFNLCVLELLLPTAEKQPHVGRNVTAIKQYKAKLYYDSMSFQFMKLQAVDDNKDVLQSKVKSMTSIIFEIWIRCLCWHFV